MKINPLIIELLKKRGITQQSDVEEFLSDKPKKTYDPFLLADMEAGVDLILSEIMHGSRICIYGDYDADGITSTALMLAILSKLTEPGRLSYYIPSRFEEGYGLNSDAIRHIASKGCNLIITVDCGSISRKEVEYAKELGLKIMVTDHHNITDTMADCILINPKRPDSSYPFRDLSGCGVAFKLAQAIQKKAGLPKNVLTEVLDLVAVGTVGDIMPLVDENRTMVKYGLKVLNIAQRPGIKKLIEGTSLKAGAITSGNVSFVIVPHLNASGRIEDASQAVKLLAGDGTESQLENIVTDILKKNIMRKKLQSELFDVCRAQIDKEDPDDFIILDSDAAHEGIAGIVAGKIKDAYYRPAVILTPTGDRMLKGTGRSIEGIDLYKLLKTQEDKFEKFGGHCGACGFSIKEENLATFVEGIRKEAADIRKNNPDVFRKKYNVELDLKTADMTVELADQLNLLAPFGNGNPKPLIICRNCMISGVKYMGDEMQHVRFMILSDDVNHIQCVLFNKAQDYDFENISEEKVSVIGTLDSQIWQGTKRLQFLVNEIQIDG